MHCNPKCVNAVIALKKRRQEKYGPSKMRQRKALSVAWKESRESSQSTDEQSRLHSESMDGEGKGENAFRVKSKDEQDLATGKGTHLAH